jgi:hypothetical protein
MRQEMSAELDVYHDVTKVEIIGDYLLRLTFDDGTQQEIYFKPLLYGPIFEPLRDLKQFNQVTLNPDTGTIEWPTGADFNPTLLHNWPHYKEHIIAERRQRYAVSTSRQ